MKIRWEKTGNRIEQYRIKWSLRSSTTTKPRDEGFVRSNFSFCISPLSRFSGNIRTLTQCSLMPSLPAFDICWSKGCRPSSADFHTSLIRLRCSLACASHSPSCSLPELASCCYSRYIAPSTLLGRTWSLGGSSADACSDPCRTSSWGNRTRTSSWSWG